jgi:hypothetical protein
MGHKKVHTGCSMMNMSENSSTQTKESKHTETGRNYFNAPCCSKSEFSNNISIQLYTIEILKDNFKAPLITYYIFQLSNVDLYKDDITEKDRQCLLKGPINFIISFIQHSISLSVDEAEPISSLLYIIA